MPVTFRSTGQNIGRKLQRLNDQGKQATRVAMTAKLHELIEEGFQLEQEPRGRGWEPRTRDYPWMILDRTGKMRRSFHVDVSGANIVISNTARERGRNYPIFHQFGWHIPTGGRAPARQVMPVSAMSARWRNELDRVVAQALERV